MKAVNWLFLWVLAPHILGEVEVVSDNAGDENKASKLTSRAKDRDQERKQATNEISLPEYLTMDTFDKLTSEQLSFVEFFSPYCSHCKELAPTWEKTYKEFYEQLNTLNVQMRQVNCIESGDLCEREEVTSYPNLRIYSPIHDRQTGAKTGHLKLIETYPRALVRNPDNFKKFVKNAVAEYEEGSIDLPSASKQLSLDRLLELIAGKGEQPEFVMFHQGTDQQWQITQENGRSEFSKSCYDCLDNVRIWSKLSNKILTTINTNHFSCLSNPDICEKLGLKSLNNPDTNTEPKAIMFLPEKTGIIRFDFKGPFTVEALKKFARDLYENHHYENVSAKTLSEIMEFRKSLPKEPLQQFYPLANQISIVFYYDVRTVSEEDRAILPYILEYVTYSPFNIHLYTAKSNKFEGAINSQAMNILDYIHYDQRELPRPFNKAMYLATTLTTKPTIFVIKDNTLFTSVFQSYAPEDIRNKDKVLDFIKRNQFPLYQELTPELFLSYFGNTDDKNKNDIVVVTFIDSNNADFTDKSLYNISLAAHEYHEVKNEYYFNDILRRRNDKTQAVEELKRQNAASVQIIKEMRREVPHFFDSNQVLFTFIDIAHHPELADYKGWNINSRTYVAGDTLVIHKDNRYYYDTDIQGNELKNDPGKLKQVLQYFLDPALVPDVVIMNKCLVSSPYMKSLRFMDYIHERGFIGYGSLLIIIFVISKSIAKYNGSRRNLGDSGGVGILGNLPKKD